MSWRSTVLSLAAPTAVAALLSAPALYLFWSAQQAAQAAPFTFKSASFWGASLNSLPLPYIFHPLLGSFAASIYRGITYEQATTNLGLVAVIAAIGGWLAACAAAVPGPPKAACV